MKKKILVSGNTNYSRQLIKLIKESDIANSSTLTLALLGVQPTNAAEVAIRYCNNNPIKAMEVINDLIPTVNMAQQSYLLDVIKIISSTITPKSL